MGTNYTMTGQIDIEPSLNFAQIKAVYADAMEAYVKRFGGKTPGYLSGSEDNPLAFPIDEYLPLKPLIEEDEVETDEGIMTRKVCSALVPAYEVGRMGSVNMDTQVQRLISLFPTHGFSGEVIAVREDGAQGYKLVVKQAKATQYEGRAHMVFDNGDQHDLSALL